MRTKWLLLAVGILTAILAVGAIACGGDDEELEDILDEIEQELEDLGIIQLTASPAEVDGSGASGEAGISPNGDGILVTLSMQGLSEGAHANHLHDGSCAEQGDVHIALDNIVADENGDGSQTTSSEEASIDHFAEGHYLAVHAEDGAVISCGDIAEA